MVYSVGMSLPLFQMAISAGTALAYKGGVVDKFFKQFEGLFFYGMIVVFIAGSIWIGIQKLRGIDDDDEQ